MFIQNIDTVARVAVAFALLTVTAIVVLSLCAPFKIPEPWRARVNVPGILAVELPKNAGELNAVLGGNNREAARRNVRFDSFFIASYTLMFLAWSLLLPGNRAVAQTTIFLALATAFFDVAENRAILMATDAHVINEEIVRRLVRFSSIKWAAFFLAALGLASRFTRCPVPVKILAMLQIVVALGGLAAALAAMSPLWIEMARATVNKATIGLAVMLLIEMLLLAVVPSRIYPQGRDDSPERIGVPG